MQATPREIGRNEFDDWCWRRGLDLRGVAAGLRATAERLERTDGAPRRVPSVETIRRVRLPFSHADRRVPATEMMELIKAFTGGEITPAHFYPPHIRGDARLAEVQP